MVKIIKTKHKKLKLFTNIDIRLLKQFIDSLDDIKAGRIKRVR